MKIPTRILTAAEGRRGRPYTTPPSVANRIAETVQSYEAGKEPLFTLTSIVAVEKSDSASPQTLSFSAS